MKHLYIAEFGEYNKDYNKMMKFGPLVPVVAESFKEAVRIALVECPRGCDLISLTLTNANVRG